MDLSIVIVTWNAREHLAACLDSLADHPFRGESEMIVVDSASSDGTAAMVRERFPRVRLLALDENRGFAAGNNAGLREAGGRFALLLNPDTLVHAGALDALVEFAEAHPRAWAVGPKLLDTGGALQRTGVRFPSAWNLLVETLFLDRLLPGTRLFAAHRELFADPGQARRVDYLQGSCLLLRAEALARVGLLDEGYFLYFEETDWCRRCADAGGEVHYAPQAVVTHHGGGGDPHYGEARLVLYHESLLRYCGRHLAPVHALAVRAVLVLRSLVRLLLWLAIAITGVRDRARAWSSVRGYARVLPWLFAPARERRAAGAAAAPSAPAGEGRAR
jgi:GT2 family glycosyltransferase